MIIVRPGVPYVPPTVVARSGGSNTSTFVTAQPITLPSSSSGDLLLVIFSPQAGQTTTTSQTGWTKVYGAAEDPNIEVWGGVSGTAQTPLTLTTSAACGSCHITYSVSSWSGTVSHIEATKAVGNSTNMNPPSLTPSHGSFQYLWIVAGAGGNGSDTAPSAAPTDFSNLQTRNTGSTLDTHTGLGSAERLFDAATLDPGTFTSTTADWTTVTLAVLGQG